MYYYYCDKKDSMPQSRLAMAFSSMSGYQEQVIVIFENCVHFLLNLHSFGGMLELLFYDCYCMALPLSHSLFSIIMIFFLI